jgi:tRNA uridine 5-carboxymethylaminomethyl modification enzyme
MKKYDVVIIGGGHSGIEASYILSRVNLEVCLVTLYKEAIGRMSCNPSIGGVGKGHLVREIDALGGIMAKTADKTGIQFRLLNSSKGSAVQGLRCQSDRELYSLEMRKVLQTFENIDIIEGEAIEIKIKNGKVDSVLLENGSELKTGNVIISAGTFLRGKLFTGFEVKRGGRINEKSSTLLSKNLEKEGIVLKRLKTGTPARLKKSSINLSNFEVQKGDEIKEPFSLFSKPFPVLPQVDCFITYTNKKTSEIVKSYLDQSPLYQGLIKGIGPRYCPSLEDKVVKFPHHERHQVFLEPVSLNSDEIYPNGISTSLPKEAQDKFIRSIEGLESAEILTYGYAVEYDFIEPTNLDYDLSLKGIDGLYFSGQVIGTTGYEEAAGLGLYAAYNVIKKLKKKERFTLKRSESYLGVMVDDLVSKGILEPYRLFTSRAEYRMLLDRHTAYRRLTKYAIEENLLSHEEILFREKWEKEFDYYLKKLKDTKVRGGNLYQRLKRMDCDRDEILREIGCDDHFMKNYIVSEVQNEGYKKRFLDEIKRIENSLNAKIPLNIDYKKIPGLSREMVERFNEKKPKTLFEAFSIPGVTPSAITILKNHLEKSHKK